MAPTTLTAAERARTLLATASGLHLSTSWWNAPLMRHAIDIDGSILIAESALHGGPVVQGSGAPAPMLTLTATDVCAVAQPSRVRGRVSVRGPIHRVNRALPEGVRDYLVCAVGATEPTGDLVRLYPMSVSVEWLCEGQVTVTDLAVEDYTCASLDPLVGWESEWIEHLERDHTELLRRLVHAQHPEWSEPTSTMRAERVSPLVADQFGLVVRVYDEARGGAFDDVRLPFASPAQCGCEAVEALNVMAGLLPGAV